jgi:MFS family permease
LWLSAFVISLSSFLFGYGMSALNTVLVTGDDNDAHHCYKGTDNSCPEGSLLNDLDLSIELQQVATGLTILGAWMGCFLSSYPNEKLGRKTTLLANNIFFISGGILCGISNELTLYIGRFLLGVGVGVESMVAPVLLSEISSDENRGTITTTHQLMVTIGILAASLIGYGFVTTTEHGWQYAQLFILLPSVLQIAMAAYLPESPRWLCQ